jgi:hypothetical protein
MAFAEGLFNMIYCISHIGIKLASNQSSRSLHKQSLTPGRP